LLVSLKYRAGKSAIINSGDWLMAHGRFGFIKSMHKRPIAGGMLVIQLILAVLGLHPIISPALAGTETGEFCCTCPDYENFDAWLAKKAQLCDNAGNQIEPGSNPANAGKTVSAKKAITYPKPLIITSADSNLDGPVIIDVRSPDEYVKGHLSNARDLYWKETQPNGDFDPAVTESALRKIGIKSSDSLLIYGGADDKASYIFWALSYLGSGNLSKLDGGIDEAVKQGMSLDKSVPQVKESNYTSHIVSSLLINESQLGRWLERSDVQILDAREYSEYGKARLTNASLPLDASMLYQDNFKIKDAKTLDDILGRRLDKNKTQLVYGTPEAYSLFYALKLMGYNATILEGSWWKETKWAVSMIR
jgi:thiosulfate/3-mercaptopyruvate sulfurtransferase